MQPETVNASAVCGQPSPLPNGGNGDGAPLANGGNGESEPLPPVLNGDRSPSVAAPDVRDSRGRFVKGNPGGPGNPHGRRVERRPCPVIKPQSHRGSEFFSQRLRVSVVKQFKIKGAEHSRRRI